MKNPARKTWLAALGVLFLLFVAVFAAACGTQSYTLTFVTNGGTEIAPITAEAGAQITPPADPEKEGAVFGGWYTSADFSGEAVEIPTTMPSENITYYAKFDESAATATLTLDPGIGSLTATTYELAVGENVYDFVSQIVPTAADGLTFGGWFVGDPPTTMLSAGMRMPTAGLKLTARYTVPYTVEVYLQNAHGLTGEENYTKSTDITVEGGSGYVGDTVDAATLPGLSTPTGYTMNTQLTQPLVLQAGENVCKVYYDIRSFTVRYNVNLPDGATSEGEMQDVTVWYDGTVELPACGYTIDGYRFAGWGLMTGSAYEVDYAVGDSVDVDEIASLGTVINFGAVWNRGLTDVNGGSDVLYILQEEPGTILLERAFSADREGTYDAVTGLFWFGESAEDNTDLHGRALADGATYAYYYDTMDAEFAYFDRAEETTTSVKLELDGVDGATYTDAEGVAHPGTYAPYNSSEYRFVATDDSELEFYFRLGVWQEQYVFQVNDGYSGAYYYYTGSGLAYPAIVVDGYGTVVMMDSEGSALGAGSYEVQSDAILELTFAVSEKETQTLLIRLGAVQNSAGQAYPVYTTADIAANLTLEFTITDTREMSVTLNGFGTLTYEAGDIGGEADDSGSAPYQFLGTYTDGETNYAIFYFYLGTSQENVTFYTIRYNRDTNEAERVGNEAGVYAEYGATSGYTMQLFLDGDGKATLSVLMTSGSYLPVIEGSYAAVEGETNVYTFADGTFVGGDDLASAQEALLAAYGSFTFWLTSLNDGSVIFIVKQELAENTYTFEAAVDESGTTNEFIVTLDGYGIATQTNATAGSDPQTMQYTFYTGYEADGHSYSFLYLTNGYSGYYLRVEEDSTEAYFCNYRVYGTYAQYFNRLGTEDFALQLFPDTHAIIWTEGSGSELVQTATGSYSVGEDNILTFKGAQGTEAPFDTFRFNINQSYGILYVEVAGEAQTLKLYDTDLVLDGFGRATYGKTTFFYMFEEDNGQTWLILDSGSGSSARIRMENGAIAQPDSAMGSYYSYDGETLGQYLLTLDGYGNATLQTVDKDSEKPTTVATGTYTFDSDDNFYSVEWAEDAFADFTFIFSYVTDGTYRYPVYITGDDNAVTYVVEDGVYAGATLERDQFGRVTFTDKDGNALTVRYQVSTLDEKDYLFLFVYDEDGDLSAAYLYQVNATASDADKTLKQTDGQVGSYALVENGLIDANRSLELNGFGLATLNTVSGEPIEGTYKAVEGSSNEWTFESKEKTFKFLLTTVSTSDGTSQSVYIIYSEKWDAQLTSSDWQVIVTDGYVSAILIDFYGRAYQANYTVLGEGNILHLYGSSLGDRYFSVKDGSFTEVTDDFIVENGVLLAYQGNGGDIKIPDGVTEIADSVFYLRTDITSVDLNQVQVIGDYAFQANTITSFTGTGNVTTIGNYAFYQSIYLESVAFPNVVTVGEYAFARSTALENVSLGDKLTSIGNNAFAHCAAYNDGVFTLTLAGAVANLTMGENVFDSCGTLGVYVAVSDLEAVKAYRTTWGGTDYAQYVGLDLSDEAAAIAGTYYTDLGAEQAAMLVLGVQVLLNGDAIGVYTVSGTAVTVTLFDELTATAEGALADGVITITLNDTAYTFYPEGTERSFTDSDDNDELTIQLGYGTTTGLYKGESVEVVIDADEGIYFILDGYRHTLTLDLEGNTFTEEIAFERYTVTYTSAFNDYYDNVLTLTYETLDKKSVTMGTTRDDHLFYLIDGRSNSNGKIYQESAGAWTIEWLSSDDEAQTATYRIVAPQLANRVAGTIVTYSILVTVNISDETLQAGSGEFSFRLEKTVYPEATVTGATTAVVTAYYAEPADGENGTGAIERMELNIGGTVVTGTLSAEGEVYTLTVAEGDYAGTFVVTFKLNANTGRSITSIVFTPAEQA